MVVGDASSAFLVDNKPELPREHARGDDNMEKLWRLSERLVGEEFDV